ncbi:hypothetical protein BJ165DRAFT_1535072 [Panaeolus papilionaceus]|nr:hypothetical protein BJ165DRAFT_1535072 [Panaeolus papilionaceus]
MRSLLLTGTSVLLFVSHALALAETSLTRSAFQRTTSGSSCDTICNSFDDTACDTRACICTAPNAQTLQQCITCYMTSAPSQDTAAAAQNLIDTFDDACSGYNLPPVTIPSTSGPTGGSPNPPGVTSRGTTSPITSITRVNNPGPAPAQQTNTANFPAASAANNPNVPQMRGDAKPTFLVSNTILGVYLAAACIALAL